MSPNELQSIVHVYKARSPRKGRADTFPYANFHTGNNHCLAWFHCEEFLREVNSYPKPPIYLINTLRVLHCSEFTAASEASL
jgi:hypothetical protein